VKKGAFSSGGTAGTTASDGAGGQATALESGVEQATFPSRSAELVEVAAQAPGQSQALTLPAPVGPVSRITAAVVLDDGASLSKFRSKSGLDECVGTTTSRMVSDPLSVLVPRSYGPLITYAIDVVYYWETAPDIME
jgi:hypothetical protein